MVPLDWNSIGSSQPRSCLDNNVKEAVQYKSVISNPDIGNLRIMSNLIRCLKSFPIQNSLKTAI